MEFFDSHAHYDDARFDDERDKLIEDVYKSGVTRIISAGYSLEGSIKSLELSCNIILYIQLLVYLQMI